MVAIRRVGLLQETSWNRRRQGTEWRDAPKEMFGQAMNRRCTWGDVRMVKAVALEAGEGWGAAARAGED